MTSGLAPSILRVNVEDREILPRSASTPSRERRRGAQTPRACSLNSRRVFGKRAAKCVPRAGCSRACGAEHANIEQLRWIWTGGRDLPSTRWLRTPDANNPLPLMTGEKQCAGFNTGSESGPRSCVVGGHLSTGRRTIAAATASKSSRSSIGCFHGPAAPAAARRLPSVRLYGNAIRQIKTRAHRGHRFHPLAIDPNFLWPRTLASVGENYRSNFSFGKIYWQKKFVFILRKERKHLQ